ncbi:MAG: BfmA/BtgA family mobilization protein [Bacteroidota bacterium]
MRKGNSFRWKKRFNLLIINTCMATKSIKIDEEIHIRAVRLAEGKKASLKEYVEAAITYFYKTRLDPTDLNDSGPTNMLLAIEEKIGSLETLIKEQQAEHLLQLQSMLSGTQAAEMKLNGLPIQKETEVNALIKELYSEGVCCPNCNRPQDFQFEDPHLHCQHTDCEYTLPVVFGEVVLESLDVMNLLTGGISRHFSTLTIDGQQQAGRLFLDSSNGYQPKLLPLAQEC